MPVEVVDASAIAAVLFVEPEAASVAARLNAGRLVAPTLLDFELPSICLKKLRRHPGDRDVLLRGFALRERMAIEIVAVEQPAVVALAEAASLTAYDASYLWLARRLGAGLITLDRRWPRPWRPTRSRHSALTTVNRVGRPHFPQPLCARAAR